MKAITGACLCLLVSMNYIQFAEAKIENQCTPGNDLECQSYGGNMCCAHITYTFGRENQDFHACASRLGIETAGPNIYDVNGFVGYWYCNQAMLSAGSLLLSSLIVLTNAF